MHTSRIRKERHIAGTTLDADAIMARATPQTHQDGHDPQPYGHQVAMPIALSAGEARESVANLNQILAGSANGVFCTCRAA
jgi:hypothetical protein